MVDGDGFDDRSEWRFGCECARLWRKEMLHFGAGALPVAEGRVHVLEEDACWMLEGMENVALMAQGAAVGVVKSERRRRGSRLCGCTGY